MKNYVTEIIKDVVISVLLIMCVIIIISIFLYDKIALTRVIPESEEYFLTEEMKQEIEDKNIEDTEEVIVNYYIDATDLRKYDKSNEYVKGKNNPFDEISSYDGNVDTNNNTSSDSDNKGFFEDDGTK